MDASELVTRLQAQIDKHGNWPIESDGRDLEFVEFINMGADSVASYYELHVRSNGTAANV